MKISSNVNNNFTQFTQKTIDSCQWFFYIYLCKRDNNEVTMNLQQINHFIMTNTNIETLDLIIQEAKERIHTLAQKNKKVAKPKKVVKVEEKKEENVWDKMTDKQKIEHIKKLMENGSGKKNPLTGNRLIDDAAEIGDIGNRFMNVIHRLEDYWYKEDFGTSAEFDDFTEYYQEDIMKDLLNGGKINEVVKEYKECM